MKSKLGRVFGKRAAIIALGLSVGSGAFADVTTGGLESGGTLFLNLGTADNLTWDKTGGVENIYDLRDLTGKSADGCKLQLGTLPPATPQPQFMLMTATNGTSAGTPGFNNQKNWIGVREQSRGVDCGRVSPSQALQLTLGSALTGYSVAETWLEINAKQNVVVKAVATVKGKNPQYFWLETGLSATDPQGPNQKVVNGQTVTVNITWCNAGISDSSPDVNANCQWNFKGLYDQITLTNANNGAWSLASAGTTNPTRFALVKADGILDCGDSTISASSGTNSAIVQGRRLTNTDGSQCVPIPYSLSSQQCVVGGDGTNTACQTKFLYDPLGQNQSLAFFFTWSWPLESLTPISSVAPTVVTFSSGNTTTLDTCAGSTANYTGGQFVSLTPPPGGFVDQDAAGPNTPLAGVQAACLLRREVQQNGIGVFVGEDGYIQGDVVFNRH
jgi:hypothetical protein